MELILTLAFALILGCVLGPILVFAFIFAGGAIEEVVDEIKDCARTLRREVTSARRGIARLF